MGERRWSEEWTLGSDTNPAVATSTVALRGPAIYHEQTVEVVPKLEADQHVTRLEHDLAECRRDLESIAQELKKRAQQATGSEHALGKAEAFYEAAQSIRAKIGEAT